ncbi:hypothetical protein ACOSQ3_013225 [Xanthoceras sorbifolium]
MTSDASLLTDLKPCSDGFTVKIADGSISKVAGIGSAKILPSITLYSVLLVPNLNCNLLSITKITKDRNCMAKFTHNLCEFQDLDSERMIGSAELCSGLSPQS